MVTPENLILTMALLSALGCGVMSGLFYAFSFCVMNALNRQPPAQAVTTMQSINETIIHPIFFVLFFGTAAVCAMSVVASLKFWELSEAGFLLSGGVLYLIGSVLVTFRFNIPMNNALASSKANEEKGVDYWPIYFKKWTAWNHVRFVSALAAAALFVVAIGK